MSDGPRVLILGGTGFIARSLVKYIVDYNIASAVRVVDRVLPVMAHLTPTYKQAYEAPVVEFVQANLALEDHVTRAFTASAPFNIVVNLAAETKFGQLPEHYETYIVKLRGLCAQAAAAMNVDKYVEVSTCQVYESSNSKPATEEKGKLHPWTSLGKYHLEAENVVRGIPGLNYVILRLPIVYGPGDKTGLMPRIICAAVYQHTRLKMEFLWGEDLRINTVHVQDAAAAIWHAVCLGQVGEIYNVVDDGETSQGTFNKVLEAVFDIKTGFYNTLMSNIAQLKLNELTEEANEGHMQPWDELLKSHGIMNSPLSPYLEKELLSNNPLSVDGSKFKALGFTPSCPQLTKELLVEAVQYWIDLKKFPPVLKNI